MRILITGAEGFIGKNLLVRLSELRAHQVMAFNSSTPSAQLQDLVDESDFIFHLAGENRPKDNLDFLRVNVNLTRLISDAIVKTGRCIPLVFTSSAQVGLDNPYGHSKRMAEEVLEALFKETANPIVIFRLPRVFGKWCKPNYNSVVATFCYNIAHDIPIAIHDKSTIIDLVYIDDVINRFIGLLGNFPEALEFQKITPQHHICLEDLARQIAEFKSSRENLTIDRVGIGFARALYSTYMSYLPIQESAYQVKSHSDARGVFVEMLKTPDSGQFSYFTAHPGVTRGGHYHHTKIEKFLVVNGQARFKFRNVLTNEEYEVSVSSANPTVVETLPGWSHAISNVGLDQLIVVLWTNETFDPDRPDTIFAKV